MVSGLAFDFLMCSKLVISSIWNTILGQKLNFDQLPDLDGRHAILEYVVSYNTELSVVSLIAIVSFDGCPIIWIDIFFSNNSNETPEWFKKCIFFSYRAPAQSQKKVR